MEKMAEPLNLDRRSIIRLATGTISTMRFDYRICEKELEYIREHGKLRTKTQLYPQEKGILNGIRLRTFGRCSGTQGKGYTSNAKIINQNLDIYAEELRAEQEEILDFFDSLFFAFALPDYEAELCKAAFIESTKRKEKGIKS